MTEYEVLTYIHGYQERIDDLSERLSIFAAPLYNIHVRKRGQQKQPKDFFDREKIRLARVKAAESEDPEDIKARRRATMKALKESMPAPILPAPSEQGPESN